MKQWRRVLVGGVLAGFGALSLNVTLAAAVSGAIYTTNGACNGVNVNIFTSKADVYVNGGPQNVNSAGLADGFYFIKVTVPDGTLLGTSVGSANEQPVHVTNGVFDSCYHLVDVVLKASDSTPGFDDTTNGGGEYKVWVSTSRDFTGSTNKTDNFKVQDDGLPLEQAQLDVLKFYDANTNGVKDGLEPNLIGWKVHIQDGLSIDRLTPASVVVEPDTYTVSEYATTQLNWLPTSVGVTGATSWSSVAPAPGFAAAAQLDLANGNTAVVTFGNVCLGTGGGLTLGFWSNRNGQAAQFGTTTAANATLAFLSSLNLRDANGNNYDPTSYAGFRTWLLAATATNMANMLSAQLAAMELNVRNGNVLGTVLVYAPGAVGANVNGFISVNALMAEANAELGLHGNTPSGSEYRSYQEALKTALDKANNNLTFVQAQPCAFSFAE